LIIFLPLWINQYYFIALLFLFINFLLDVIDGELARMLKTDSDLGKFEDLMVDNFMVVVLPLALIWQGLVPGFLGAYYIFVATLSWWLSVIRRNRGVKSDWIFRPEASGLLHFSRFWVLTILMFLYVFSRVDVFTNTILVLSIVLTVSCIYDYYQIIKERLHNR
jgi:phosphatidylglycerophosphate synthase